MNKIAIFTGSRAEYGLMRILLMKLKNDKVFDYELLVSGSHFDPKFGNTINEIKKDGLVNIRFVPIDIESSERKKMSLQTAEVIKLISSVLDELAPKYLIVLGDRYETFGAAAAAHLLGIEIIHLHGGETSLGALDDKLRHAISQLSTIHFTSLDIHAKKVQNIIGSKKNVFNVGPMVIDGLLNFNLLSKNEFEEETGFLFSNRNLLITYHPETLSSDYGLGGFENLLSILHNYDFNILFTAPNADYGSNQIIKLINQFISKKQSQTFYIPSLGQKLYLNAIALFDLIIGNSSSGIIEAPLLNKKVLNIGNRQKGRYRFGPVIDINNDLESISYAFEKVLNINESKNFDFIKFKEIYGKRSPSDQIIKILKNFD